MSRRNKTITGWMVLSLVLMVFTTVSVHYWREAARMEEAQRARVAALADEQAVLHELLNSSDYGLSILDHEGRILEWNKALERMTGYMAEDVLGKTIEHMMSPEAAKMHREAYAKAIRDLSATRRVQIVHCEMLTADGSRISVKVSVRVVILEGRRPYAVANIDRAEDVVEVQQEEASEP